MEANPRVPSLARRWLGWWTEQVARLEPFQAVALMTLLCLMIYGNPAWYFQIPFGALFSAALLFPSLLRAEGFWFAVCGLTLGVLALDWYARGNHAYLFAYWVLAVFLSRLAPDPMRVLALSGRWIIGLVFLLACLWKFISPDFRSGDFFHYMLLHDYRLAPVGAAVGVMTLEEAGRNQDALPKGLSGPIREGPVVFESTPGVRTLALGLTWLTLGLEGLVALAFLWPLGRGLSRYRDAVMLAFMGTAYVVAPSSPVARGGYIALFLILQVMGARLSAVTF